MAYYIIRLTILRVFIRQKAINTPSGIRDFVNCNILMKKNSPNQTSIVMRHIVRSNENDVFFNATRSRFCTVLFQEYWSWA